MVRAGGYVYPLCLQVELLHEFPYVQVEIRLVLLYLRVDKVSVGTGHAYLSPSAPPVQDWEGNAQADVLLVQWIPVGIFQLVGSLRQAEAQVDVCFQSGIGLGARHGTLAFHLAAQHVLYLRTVFVGKHQCGIQVDVQVGHAVVYSHLYKEVFLDAEVGTEFLHAVFHFDAGIHAVGFFGQFVEFELQHFVFADGADVISSLRIYI